MAPLAFVLVLTMIKEAIVRWDVNPNRVYMLGISEGAELIDGN